MIVNEQKITYRKATPNDWSTVISCEKTADLKTFRAVDNENDAKSYIKESNVYLIGLGKEIIGTISFVVKDQNWAHLDGLTIKPEYRNHGFATSSIKWLLDQIRSEYGIIDLVTHPQNSSAIHAYTKNGFEVKERKENYFGDGEPRIRMELIIK